MRDQEQLIDSCIIDTIVEQNINRLTRLKSKDVYRYILRSELDLDKKIVYGRIRLLKKGNVVLSPLSNFGGQWGYRNGKDESYEKFWDSIDKELPDFLQRKYIGLTSTQLDVVRSKVNSLYPINV